MKIFSKKLIKEKKKTKEIQYNIKYRKKIIDYK